MESELIDSRPDLRSPEVQENRQKFEAVDVKPSLEGRPLTSGRDEEKLRPVDLI